MALSEQTEVGATAVVVVPSRDAFKGVRGARNALAARFVTIKNIGSTTMYIGGEDVTPDNGLSIGANGAFNLTLAGADAIWAVTAGATTTAAYVETGGAVI